MASQLFYFHFILFHLNQTIPTWLGLMRPSFYSKSIWKFVTSDLETVYFCSIFIFSELLLPRCRADKPQYWSSPKKNVQLLVRIRKKGYFQEVCIINNILGFAYYLPQKHLHLIIQPSSGLNKGRLQWKKRIILWQLVNFTWILTFILIYDNLEIFYHPPPFDKLYQKNSCMKGVPKGTTWF